MATGPLLSPRIAIALGALGLVLQLVALSPPFTDNVDENQTLHYTQHGIVVLGGILMGVALRDLLVLVQRGDVR